METTVCKLKGEQEEEEELASLHHTWNSWFLRFLGADIQSKTHTDQDKSQLSNNLMFSK